MPAFNEWSPVQNYIFDRNAGLYWWIDPVTGDKVQSSSPPTVTDVIPGPGEERLQSDTIATADLAAAQWNQSGNIGAQIPQQTIARRPKYKPPTGLEKFLGDAASAFLGIPVGRQPNYAQIREQIAEEQSPFGQSPAEVSDPYQAVEQKYMGGVKEQYEIEYSGIRNTWDKLDMIAQMSARDPQYLQSRLAANMQNYVMTENELRQKYKMLDVQIKQLREIRDDLSPTEYDSLLAKITGRIGIKPPSAAETAAKMMSIQKEAEMYGLMGVDKENFIRQRSSDLGLLVPPRETQQTRQENAPLNDEELQLAMQLKVNMDKPYLDGYANTPAEIRLQTRIKQLKQKQTPAGMGMPSTPGGLPPTIMGPGKEYDMLPAGAAYYDNKGNLWRK